MSEPLIAQMSQITQIKSKSFSYQPYQPYQSNQRHLWFRQFLFKSSFTLYIIQHSAFSVLHLNHLLISPGSFSSY